MRGQGAGPRILPAPLAPRGVLRYSGGALTETKPNPNRAGLMAAGGAVLFAVVALGGSVGLLTLRGSEERRVLDLRTTQCRASNGDACDFLRTACLNRNGDACAALADVALAPGARHDVREATRLLGEACEYHQRDACLRGGRLLLEGTLVPKDAKQARALLDRGCEFGAHEACALRQTVP